MITINFEKRGNKTLTEFLYDSIRLQILDGTLLENEKLPSKRTLALHLGVSVITVQNAYMQLIDEGYIYSIEKKGFFVSDIARHFGGYKSDVGGAKFGRVREESASEENMCEENMCEEIASRSQPDKISYIADFTSNAVAPEKFPFSLWSKTMRQVLSSENENLLKRTDVFGLPELRRAICHYLKAFRNMNVFENQVIIGAGTESLYSMLVQFLGRDQIFAVENPGYHKAAEIFKLNGVKCIPVKIDGQGIIVSELNKAEANVVHVSPSHHFPTGIIMNYKRRIELLNWAGKKNNRFIIEDDYDSEFRFIGKPLSTLQSIDENGRVIYINTFSKTLSPSFRISYMVLPISLAEKFSKKLGFYSCQVSSFEQFTLARFIQDGNYEKHINKMKNYYRSLRNNLITAIQMSKLSKVCSINEEDSGLHFLLTVQNKKNARALQEQWKSRGIKIQLLSDYYYEEADLEESFVVNYSGIKREEIAKIVKLMCKDL